MFEILTLSIENHFDFSYILIVILLIFLFDMSSVILTPKCQFDIWHVTENDLHHPLSTIIVLENTLNGAIFPQDEIKKIRVLADKHGLTLHLDGARWKKLLRWEKEARGGIELWTWSDPGCGMLRRQLDWAWKN